MKRLTVAIVVLAALATSATVAFADSPHFVQGPNYTATTSALTASGKAAGLGQSATQAFLTAASIDVSFHCVNKGNNFAPGHPATSSGVTGPTQDIAPRNGQITFSPSLPAPVPSTSECPNRNWRVIVDSVFYNDVVLHIQQNGVDILTDGPNDFTA